MGFFNHIEVEIMHWQACGRNIDETYIYWKDYVSREDVERIFSQDCDEDPVEAV